MVQLLNVVNVEFKTAGLMNSSSAFAISKGPSWVCGIDYLVIAYTG